MHSYKLACVCIGLIGYIFSSVASEQANQTSKTNSFLVTGRNVQHATPTESTCDNSSSSDDSSPLDDFPPDLFTGEQRLHGAIILHIFAAIYFFTLLAVVCNDYFLPSVECICEDLDIPTDLAAATFMAVATTTPEFFTNVISTFITESDIGLGTIIGSLMFNTLGVAAVASLATIMPVQLDWWPITRDSILYGSNVLVLIVIAWDAQVTLTETIIMVVLFFVYFVILFQNKRVMPRVKWFLEEYLHCCKLTSYDLPSSFVEKNFQNTIIKQQPNADKMQNEAPDTEKIPIPSEINPPQTPGSWSTTSSINNGPIYMIYNKQENVEDGKETNRKSLWRIPTSRPIKAIWWLYTWPIKLVLTLTVPNPKTYRRLYPLTFLMCIIWIGINAYMIVWMITVIGLTFQISDAVMGLTFLAAGGCMPEGISSVLTVRKGEGGVGVSNSLGANSLAIMMSLGIPWMIKNIMHRNDPQHSSIRINSSSIKYNTLLLLLAVIALYVILTVSRYRLKKSVGLALISIYAIFISFGVILESNVFTQAKPC